jgi:VIT1/CCC1 family predicted Fe2+/Mn2+ transporter
MSMAAGEYVSVHSQADTEKADLQREESELANDPVVEQQELAAIYMGRGLDRNLASQVATQLMAHNALETHARDELGITEALSARPIQAALISALSFAVGAVVPLLVVLLSPETWLLSMVGVTSLLCLAVLGGVAAKIGGAAVIKGALRVMFWGVLAMGITTGVGILFGTKV